MPSTRLLVVDDHSIVRLSVCSSLSQEPTFDVICQTTNGDDAVIKAHELQPDVILLDISLPGIRGHRGCASNRESLAQFPHHLHMANEALKDGGYGYVTKSEAALELLKAVRTVSRGDRFVSSRIVARAWVAEAFQEV